MTDMTQLDTARQAVLAIDRGDTLYGLLTLECAPALRTIPVVSSYLAYCIAKERGEFGGALELCQAAVDAEPHNPAHYLNLGRIYLLAHDKPNAIATFWKGINAKPARETGVDVEPSRNDHGRELALILAELRRLGIRKKVPFPSLRRSHPLNVVVGKLLSRFGLR